MATDLEDLHLADLHERAAAAGISGYRLMRRDELIAALSGEGDGKAEPEAAAEPSAAAEPEAEAEDEAKPRRRRRSRRRRKPEAETEERSESESDTDEMAVVEATVLDDAAEKPVEVEQSGAPEDDLPTEGVSGVLELTRQRYGFIRLSGLAPTDGDVYISAAQVRRCELRAGDEVAGPAREPRRGERHRALVHVDTVNGEEPLTEARPLFDDLPADLPERRMPLDAFGDDVLVRAVDLLTPLAFGQRILVHAAARSGRTTLLRALARAAASDDNARVIVLLVDERPEEATAWREAVPVAEFAIATAERAPVEQVRTADLAVERARRLAEAGVDAVLICDSLSRLAVASGDVSEVKRLFGSGRNLAGGGSLTVIATVLAGGKDGGDAEEAVTTTESSQIVLDPDLAAAGVIPALRASESRISNEDQLRDPDELAAVRKLRSLLTNLRPTDAAALLLERIEGTASNAELLRSL
jgi:transcription termination factor Rho